MGGPFSLGRNLGHLRLPSLATDGLVVLGSYLYVLSDALCTPSLAEGLAHGPPALRCYRFLDSPSTLRDTAIVFSFYDVSGSGWSQPCIVLDHR